MMTCPVLATALWLAFVAWRDNGFKNIDADGAPFRPRPSLSRMRRVKHGDYGTRMTLMNDYKHGSVQHAENQDIDDV
jgi:hypothetical protein